MSKKATSKQAGKAPPAGSSASVVYLGPDLPCCRRNTVFRGRLPDAVQRAVDACPAVGKMLIALDIAASARAASMREGSEEWHLNQAIAKWRISQ